MRRSILLSFWFCEAPIIMSNPWNRPPLPIRGDDDQDTTHAAVGSVLTNWENIEGELSHIFALYIGKMWTNEAYDQYYEKGRTTKGRLQNLETAANAYFVKSPNQEAEGALCELLEGVFGFADRRHEAAHGIVRPIQWYGSLLPESSRPPPDSGLKFCLVPPHYQRTWIKDGKPEYIYTSKELNSISLGLFTFLQAVLKFRFQYLPDPRRPQS